MIVMEKERINKAATAIDAYKERNTWPKLDPLPEAAETTPDAYPMHALGKVLGEAARAIADDVQAPDALVAGSVLAAASLAAQPLANVVLPHGQRCPLSLFIVSSGQSGDRKSAADAVAGSEIEEARRRDAREYAKELQRYEDAKASKGKGDPEPEVPTPKTLTTSNATVEGLSRLLKAQSSVGLFSAEGGEMLGGHSMREDRRSAGLAFFLKAWGGETIDSLRGGDGLTTLLGRRVALHIMVQPVLLSGLLADPLAQGQGLLARCLISQPATLAGTRTYKAVDPNENPATQRFHQSVRELLGMQPAYWPEGDGHELKPRDLPMTADAAALWIAFYNEVERQQANGGELAEARPFASKAAEHAARIAGVMTMLEDPDARTIGAKAIEGAIVVTGFYVNEHLRLTGASKDARHIAELAALWDWLKDKELVSSKDVLQRTPRAIRRLKADGIKRLLTELEARGYVRQQDENLWGFAVFKVDLESLKQAATSTRLMANPANPANWLTPEAESVSQLATLATLAVSHGSHSAANDAWAAVAVAELIEAAMRCCDKHGDGPEAREEMKLQCLEIPPHLRGDLLHYFNSHYPE